MRTAELSGRAQKAVPWLWFAMSLVWAVVIIVTGQLAWPLALWVATTVGPLTYLEKPKPESSLRGSTTKGIHK